MINNLLELSYSHDNKSQILNTDISGASVEHYQDSSGDIIVNAMDANGKSIVSTSLQEGMFLSSEFKIMEGTVDGYGVKWDVSSNADHTFLNVNNSNNNSDFNSIALKGLFRQDHNPSKIVLKSLVISGADLSNLDDKSVNINIVTADNFESDPSGVYKIGTHYYLSNKETELSSWDSQNHKLLDEAEGIYLQKVVNFDYLPGLWQKGSIEIDADHNAANLLALTNTVVFDASGNAVETANSSYNYIFYDALGNQISAEEYYANVDFAYYAAGTPIALGDLSSVDAAYYWENGTWKAFEKIETPSNLFLCNVSENVIGNVELLIESDGESSLRVFNAEGLFEGFYSNIDDAKTKADSAKISLTIGDTTHNFVKFDKLYNILSTEKIEGDDYEIIFIYDLKPDTLGDLYSLNILTQNMVQIDESGSNIGEPITFEELFNGNIPSSLLL